MPQTLAAPAHSELLIKKSRFIGDNDESDTASTGLLCEMTGEPPLNT
jgi:hypothetical protein